MQRYCVEVSKQAGKSESFLYSWAHLPSGKPKFNTYSPSLLHSCSHSRKKRPLFPDRDDKPGHGRKIDKLRVCFLINRHSKPRGWQIEHLRSGGDSWSRRDLTISGSSSPLSAKKNDYPKMMTLEMGEASLTRTSISFFTIWIVVTCRYLIPLRYS